MHVVHENKPFMRRSNIICENGDDLFVDCFMLGVANGIFSVVGAFTVIVETERAGSDVEAGGDLGNETVAEEGFAGAAYADEEDDQFVCGVGEDSGDGTRVWRELLVGDFRVLNKRKSGCNVMQRGGREGEYRGRERGGGRGLVRAGADNSSHIAV